MSDIKTDAGELKLKCPSFTRQLLCELLRLRQQNTNPFSAHWFYYDRDSGMHDPHESYSFFVVDTDKGEIVRETVSFSDYNGSGFDPDVFQTGDVSDPNWQNDEAPRRYTLRPSRFAAMLRQLRLGSCCAYLRELGRPSMWWISC